MYVWQSVSAISPIPPLPLSAALGSSIPYPSPIKLGLPWGNYGGAKGTAVREEEGIGASGWRISSYIILSISQGGKSH